MVWKWREYDGILAKLVPKEMMKGIIKQDIIVRPGEEVIVIRNGKIEDTITQTRLEKIGGGFGNWLTKRFGIGEDLELLFVDTKEQDLEIIFKEISSDHDVVGGSCTLRFRIDPTKVTNIIGLMKALPQSEKDIELAREQPIAKKMWKKKMNLFWFGQNWYTGMILEKNELSRKLERELKSKIFEPVIIKSLSKDIRGNPEIREKMEQMVVVELRKTFDMWGLNLLNFYTNFEIEAHDRLEAHRREVDLTIERATIDTLPDFIKKMRDLDRKYQSDKSEIEKAFELKRMGILQDEDIKVILQQKNLERQRQLLEFKWKEREDNLPVEWKEHIQDMKEFFGEEYLKKYGVPGVADIVEKREQWKLAREAFAVGQRIREFQQKDLARDKLWADVEKEKTRLEVEKAKYDIGTYERGIEKERERTGWMMDKSAKMMEAAKQNVPHTLVEDGKTMPIIHANEESEKAETQGICSSCGARTELDWKVCPNCGTRLK
jgi:hypothetical protein